MHLHKAENQHNKSDIRRVTGVHLTLWWDSTGQNTKAPNTRLPARSPDHQHHTQWLSVHHEDLLCVSSMTDCDLFIFWYDVIKMLSDMLNWVCETGVKSEWFSFFFCWMSSQFLQVLHEFTLDLIQHFCPHLSHFTKQHVLDIIRFNSYSKDTAQAYAHLLYKWHKNMSEQIKRALPSLSILFD